MLLPCLHAFHDECLREWWEGRDTKCLHCQVDVVSLIKQCR